MLTNFTIIFRLFVAFILGSIIGFERERKGHSAGLRTHILVCVSSALIMLVSIYMYNIFKEQTNVDPSRIAASVISGIGFLCAGTIIRGGAGVKGLTTAASVWVSAAIGLCVGCGFIYPAFITAGITFFALSFLKLLEQKLEK
ncbi:MAG: MgtC/SapB family protein [Candidatus Omnitrophica bacterium]|nr:MgtC/SapB family protein [Candidatus Omnitrophota bacterium]